MAIDFTLDHPERVSTLIAASPGISGYGDDNQLIQSLQTLAAVARTDGLEEALQIVLSNPYLPQDPEVKGKMSRILLDNPQVFYLGFPTLALMISPDPPALGRLAREARRHRTATSSGDFDDHAPGSHSRSRRLYSLEAQEHPASVRQAADRPHHRGCAAIGVFRQRDRLDRFPGDCRRRDSYSRSA